MATGTSQLLCSSCGLGYASCRCPLNWATDEERHARAQEIRAVRGSVSRMLEFRKAPRKNRVQLHTELPSDLLAMLEGQRQGKESLSQVVSRCLRTHSGRIQRRIKCFGEPAELRVFLPSFLVHRLKLRARIEKSTVSSILRAHLEREMWHALRD